MPSLVDDAAKKLRQRLTVRNQLAPVQADPIAFDDLGVAKANRTTPS